MAAEQTIHLDRYAPDAKALVAGAQSLADERKHAQVEPIHLLARALDRDRGVAGGLSRRRAPTRRTSRSRRSRRSGELAQDERAGSRTCRARCSQLLARAEKEAAAAAPSDVEHLLNALSQEIRGPAAVVLQAFALGPGLASARTWPR